MDLDSSTVLDSLYAAPLDPKGWLEVLGYVEQVFPGSATVLWLPFPEPGGSGRGIAPSLPERALACYAQECVSLDPLRFHLQRLPVGGFGPGEPGWREVEPKDAGLLSWLRGESLLPEPELLGIVDRRWDFGTAALLLYRRPDSRPWGPSVRAQGQRLMPHLQRAVRIDLQMGETRARLQLARAVIDHLRTALFFVDSDTRVVEMNRAAEELLRRGEGLVLGRNGLRAEDPKDTERLRVLTAAAAIAPGSLEILQLPRGSSQRPLQVAVRAFPHRSGREQIVAALVVSDPDAPVEADQRLLRELFDLTPGESALALELLRGLRLADAARRLDIALETARNRLKQIFAKTGTNRQAELVRLLLRSPIDLG